MIHIIIFDKNKKQSLNDNSYWDIFMQIFEFKYDWNPHKIIYPGKYYFHISLYRTLEMNK